MCCSDMGQTTGCDIEKWVWVWVDSPDCIESKLYCPECVDCSTRQRQTISVPVPSVVFFFFCLFRKYNNNNCTG